jgi:hypothetical protein
MFIPTYLYIKQHSTTGLKYFGKTTANPNKYLGSGKYWLNHIKIHGKDKVDTLWSQLFTDKEELTKYARSFSETNKIVESTEWANLCNENGLDGGARDNNHFKILNKLPQKKESKEKRSKALKDRPSPKIGIKQTETAINNMSRPKRKICRLHDRLEMSVNRFTRWTKTFDELTI